MAGCSLIPPGLSYQPLQSGAAGAKLQGMEELGWKSCSERKSGWNPAWENEQQVGSAGEERSKAWDSGQDLCWDPGGGLCLFS